MALALSNVLWMCWICSETPLGSDCNEIVLLELKVIGNSKKIIMHTKHQCLIFWGLDILTIGKLKLEKGAARQSIHTTHAAP